MRPEYRRLYKTKHWQLLRASQLAESPMCKLHGDIGHRVFATVVDHIEPHKGDFDLFYDPNNLQSLCKPCHDKWKQKQERTGLLAGGDVNGEPTDKKHAWYN